MNAIPDKFAAGCRLRAGCPVPCRAPGVRGAYGQLSHLPVCRLGTCCPPGSAGSGLASGSGDAVFGGRRSGSAFPQPSLFLIARAATRRSARRRPGSVERRGSPAVSAPRRWRRAFGCIWRLLPHAPRRGARRGSRDMRRALPSRGEAQHLGLGPVLSTGWPGFVVGAALHHEYADCYDRDR